MRSHRTPSGSRVLTGNPGSVVGNRRWRGGVLFLSRPIVAALALGLVLASGSAADSGPAATGSDAAAGHGHPHDHKPGHGHHDHADAGHHEDAGHHGVVLRGLPVDGPFGKGTEFLAIDTKTMGFTLLLFGLMYVVLNRYAWGPMLAALDDREMRIRQAIEDAKLARKEVERLGAETDVEIGRAHDEAKAVLDQARAEAGREVEQKLAEARARLSAQQQEALSAIEQARVQALADLRERSIELAATMAGRVTNKRLNANEFRPLLEEVAN